MALEISAPKPHVYFERLMSRYGRSAYKMFGNEKVSDFSCNKIVGEANYTGSIPGRF